MNLISDGYDFAGQITRGNHWKCYAQRIAAIDDRLITRIQGHGFRPNQYFPDTGLGPPDLV